MPVNKLVVRVTEAGVPVMLASMSVESEVERSQLPRSTIGRGSQKAGIEAEVFHQIHSFQDITFEDELEISVVRW